MPWAKGRKSGKSCLLLWGEYAIGRTQTSRTAMLLLRRLVPPSAAVTADPTQRLRGRSIRNWESPTQTRTSFTNTPAGSRRGRTVANPKGITGSGQIGK